MNGKRLSESNKGYQLLKKAGWVEGTGLGVDKQGRTTPLPAWVNQGRRGVGSKPSKEPPSEQISPPGHESQESKNKKRTKRKAKDKKLLRIDRDGLQYRAIRRKLDREETPDGVDSNPLLRHNALSVPNPLLPT